jgi:hypothetical protein
LLVFGITVSAQERPFEIDPLLFNRMITKEITYAITGENTPVSGVKIDISKPEGTISGMYPTNKNYLPWDILSFELKGGVTDKNFNILKGAGSAGSAFEFRPTFHRITWQNSITFGRRGEDLANKEISLLQNSLLDLKMKRTLDTIYTVTLLYNYYVHELNQPAIPPKEISVIDSNHKRIAAGLLPKLTGQPTLIIDPEQDWEKIITPLHAAKIDRKTKQLDPSTFNPTLVALFRKYSKVYKNLEEENLDKKILNISEVITRKRYIWISLSPFIKTEKINEYNTKYLGQDSLYIKSNYRWTYGGNITWNFYWLTPSKWGILFRPGITLSHNNNIGNLTAYNYETKTPFFQNTPAVTQKTKNGSGYNNSDINEHFETQINTELFIFPLETFAPGLYLSTTVANSELYRLPSVAGRQKHDWRIGAEGGIIFNLTNKEKDKASLSIIPYFRYNDFSDRQRTSMAGIQEDKKDFRERNMSIGLKVAIPITLPPRSGK